MKKLLIILVLGLTAWAAWGSGWDSPDFTGAGLTTADSVNTKKVYVNTTTGDSIIAYTTADQAKIVFSVNGTRDSVVWNGASGNWFSLPKMVTVLGADGAQVQLIGSGNSGIIIQSSSAGTYTTLRSHNFNQTGYLPLRIVATSVAFDVAQFKTLAVAKDTTLEVLTMTRTCTDDTCAYMTGADSLTAAYIVSPFATRGAITIPPYVAGQAGGLLLIRRPAADTASYDRVTVTKVLQR